jgi:predicted transcriptional regulator
MRVLLSIRPEFALKIFNGSKGYEYRRTIFKNQEVSRVIVYASDPIKRIIGEFEIEDILHDELQVLWVKTKNHAGISEKRFFEYFANKSKGYAIKVKTTTMYDDPLPLNSFKVSSPPQSFMYLGQGGRQYALHRNLV